MQNKTKVIIGGAAIAAAAAAGVGIAGADNGPDDDATDRPIPATEIDRASAAALEETGEGRVTETEVDDEESWYEVEVTLDDGSQVDVQLDRNFHVVGSEADHEANGADD